MKIIKELKEPTTLILCGGWIDDETIEPILRITDDESSISIRKHDGSLSYLQTYGFVYLLTEEQFRTFINSKHYDNEYGDWEDEFFMVLKDYVGTLGAVGMRENEEFDEWDINDYFYHQMDCDEDLILDISGAYDLKNSDKDGALKILSQSNSIKLTDKLTEETKEQLFGEIENQGFGYWVQNYGYTGDADEELKDLCKKGKEIMNKLQNRLTVLGVEC
tara:strand:- start:418 stop:1074 length:657 start_codon:yes stop_codon:yes gene_type:complete